MKDGLIGPVSTSDDREMRTMLAELLELVKDQSRESRRTSFAKTTMSSQEVLVELGVSYPTLWKYGKKKLLVPFKRGGHNYYHRADVERFMNGSTS